MRNSFRVLWVICLAVVATLACGPRTTPAQRLQKARLAHEIVPVGSTTVRAADGTPTLIVDLRVTNKGTVPLRHLTVMVKVHGEDGAEKVASRVTLDLGDATPGVGVQTAATLQGVEAAESDQVTVELESSLPPQVLEGLPEFADLTGNETG